MSSPRTSSNGFEGNHYQPPLNSIYWSSHSPQMYDHNKQNQQNQHNQQNQYNQHNQQNQYNQHNQHNQQDHWGAQSHPAHLAHSGHPAYTAHQRGQSSVSQFPPILPPIPRVASKLDSSTSEDRQKAATHGSPQEQGQLLPHYSTDGFMSHGWSFDQDTVPQFQSASATTTSLSPVQSSPSPSSDVTSASQPPRLSRRSVTSPDGSFLKASSSQHSTSAASTSSATLGVPYSSTMAREAPVSGNVPLPPTTTVNGIPHHLSKTQNNRPGMPPQTKSKSRLNLLNPVNLLMRRRSSQAVETLTEKSSTTSLIVPPMNLPDGYDPRIKGNKIHDFSAPRPRRNLSYNDAVGAFPPKLEVSFANDGVSLTPIQQSPPDLSREGSDEWDHHRRGSSQHTPVFIEHFDSPTDDDMNRRTSAIQAEALANNDFVARNSWQNQQPPNLPPFGRKSQQLDEHQVHAILNHSNRSSDQTSASSASEISPLDNVHGLGFRVSEQSPVSPETAPTVHSRPVSKDLHIAEEAPSPVLVQSSSPPQRLSPISSDGHLLSPHDGSNRTSGQLRHLPSSASRFSFQIAGMDSMAEEKLLEEKHKQRHSGQQTKPPDLSDDEEDDEDEFFDEDAMYDHDEMEGFDEPEVLGGNNVFQHTHNRSISSSAMAAGVAGLHFSDMSSVPTTANPPVSPQSLQTTFPTTPGRGMQQNPESSVQYLEESQRSPPFQLASADMPLAKPTSPMSPNSFYFDDGMIDEIDDFTEGQTEKDGNVFDEDQFDDPSFLKRPQPQPQPQPQPEPARESTSSPYQLGRDSNTYNVNGYDFQMHGPYPSIGKNFTVDSPYSEASAERNEREFPASQISEPLRCDSHSQRGRNDFEAHESLSAYHSALAEAAQKAAADGRFTRQTSTATSNSTYSYDQGPEQPIERSYGQTNPVDAPWVTDDTHTNRYSYSGFDFGFQGGAPGNGSPNLNGNFPTSEVPDDGFSHHFPHDDEDDYDFDDDDMIAAANAEALAADDSGLYSQDFGFYAKPRPGSVEGETDINGGYFGQPGIEIQRQKSLREPNLTPITERSEFSTRNSFIAGPGSVGGPWSPTSFAGSAQGLPSPALSTTMQLAYQRGMSPLARTRLSDTDDNMTLAEIRRAMHPNAFTGSNSSLASDYGPVASSPLVEFAGNHYSPGHSNPAQPNIPGFFMPIPHGGNHSMTGIGGVPMAWQRSTDSNHSHSYPSSIDNVSSSPSASNAPTAGIESLSPQTAQAQAFSFFDAGDDGTLASVTNNANDEYQGSNAATPKNPASTPQLPSSPPPNMPTYQATPSTVRKAPPTAIITPAYSSHAKPSLGSPLKMESYPPVPLFSPGPVTAPAMHTNIDSNNGSAMLSYSPLSSPKSAGFASSAHKRVGSGADSVTYVQEKDAAGARRWVLERRRTSEQGFPELIGREIVEGGRI